jgi:dTDP-4-amino-4,6-dideoxygalactose transaminase
MRENAECRTEYRKDMCERSLDILGRTVFLGMHPDFDESKIDTLIATIKDAASVMV